jgi:hypothetical protein
MTKSLARIGATSSIFVAMLMLVLGACTVQRATAGQEAHKPTLSAESTGRQSEAEPLAQATPDPSFYADTNRGSPLEAAFFYSGVEGNKYKLDFGDGTSAVLTYHFPTDCFSRIRGQRTACPNYWGFHTYSAPGTYVSVVRDQSDKVLSALTVRIR